MNQKKDRSTSTKFCIMIIYFTNLTKIKRIQVTYFSDYISAALLYFPCVLVATTWGKIIVKWNIRMSLFYKVFIKMQIQFKQEFISLKQFLRSNWNF